MSSPTTGAEALIDSLIEQEVEILFGYPGGAVIPTYDALFSRTNRIRHVLVRHEQGAAHAAQGYARASGKPGVCLATSGPGATNFITGLADALMDSTPIVCITGQVPSTKLGTDAFQEADAIALTLSATKWSCQITDPNKVRSTVQRAFHVARSGRPGPVLIEITRDAQTGLVSESQCAAANAERQWDYAARSEDLRGLRQAADLINKAQRPLLLVGHGVIISGAEAELGFLAERAGIPAASTLLGLSAFDVEHPLYVGMLGMHGNYAPNLLTNEADVIVAVGMRFDDRVTGRVDTYAPNAKIVHIDIDPAEVDRHIRPAVALIGDAAKVLRELNPLIQTNTHSEWRNRFSVLAAEEWQAVIGPELSASTAELKMGEVVDALSTLTNGEAIVVSDVGQHQMAAARHYRFKRAASHITSGGLGTMGFALPAAVGASLASAGRAVVAVIGDGGFQMTLQELGTIMQERLPVKIVILNNQYLGMVRQWQELFFDQRYSQVAMDNPDFVQLAASYRISAARVSNRDELRPALMRMLGSDGPFLLDICVAQADNIFPMVPAGASIEEIRLS